MIQKSRKGQSTLEYMLYISVIVVALVALSWIAFFCDGVPGSGMGGRFKQAGIDVSVSQPCSLRGT